MKNISCNRRLYTGIITFLIPVIIFAQRQYDYDDSSIAGGADRAFNGLIIIVLLVIGAVVVLLLGNLFYKIYYGVNPEATPECEVQKAKEEKQNEEVYLNKKANPIAVDLGLSVKWCNINFGKTNSPKNKGEYCKWGELHSYSVNGYDLFNCNFNDIGDISGNPRYDIVSKIWGNGWRMPTKIEIQELIEKCLWTECEKGYNVTGPNGNSILIQRTGYVIPTIYSPSNHDEGCYWSSTPNDGTSNKEFNQSSYSLRFGGLFYKDPTIEDCAGHLAMMIRPVHY